MKRLEDYTREELINILIHHDHVVAFSPNNDLARKQAKLLKESVINAKVKESTTSISVLWTERVEISGEPWNEGK